MFLVFYLIIKSNRYLNPASNNRIRTTKNSVNSTTAKVIPQVDLRSGQRTCFNSIQAPLKYPTFFCLLFLADFLFSFLEICASLGATLTDFLSVFCFLGTTVSPDSTTLVVTLAAFFFFAFATLFSQLNNLLVSRLSILIVTNDSIFCKLAVSLKF